MIQLMILSSKYCDPSWFAATSCEVRATIHSTLRMSTGGALIFQHDIMILNIPLITDLQLSHQLCQQVVIYERLRCSNFLVCV